MVPPKNRKALRPGKNYHASNEGTQNVAKTDISTSRVAIATVLTGLTMLLFGLGCYHVWWAVKAFHLNKFGETWKNLAIILGGLAMNAFVSIKALVFLELRLLSDTIDADHQKYL